MNDRLFWIVVIIITGIFAVLMFNGKRSDTSLKPEEIGKIAGIKESGKLDNKHEQGILPYTTSPPWGGNHNPTWVGCDQQSYDLEIEKEKAVHALEHGGVWITYQPTIEKSAVNTIKAKVKTSSATFSSPFANQKSPIVLTAWGKQLEVKDMNDSRVEQFLVKYRKGKQAPEPAGTCAASGV